MNSQERTHIQYVPNWDPAMMGSNPCDPSLLAFPVFQVDTSEENNKHLVLMRSLANLWNYPSSYLLIAALVKGSGAPVSHFTNKTNEDLNRHLVAANILSECDVHQKFFYTSTLLLHSIIENKEILTSNDLLSNAEADVVPLAVSRYNIDKIDVDDLDNAEVFTISQAFPQYGRVSSQLSMSHATFNSITESTKLSLAESFIKGGRRRRIYDSKIDLADRLVLARTFDHSTIADTASPAVTDTKASRKGWGKLKNDIDVDPNSLDLSDSVLPGQGFFQEFNVNHLSKVPSYYSSSSHPAASTASAPQAPSTKKPASTSNSALLLSEAARMSKNVQLLVMGNAPETFNHSKYYYSKSYRGPGSGNYKDASLTNRIGKIPTSKAITRNVHKDLRGGNRSRRLHCNLKGFTHQAFHPSIVQNIQKRLREESEDSTNLEMLHNNLQFNVLLNTYRQISHETWNCYYKVKTTDFEQMGALQREKVELEGRHKSLQQIEEWKMKRIRMEEQRARGQIPQLPVPDTAPRINETPQLDINERFTLPSFHPEIVKRLPLEARPDYPCDKADLPVMKKAIRQIATFSGEDTPPQLLDQIDLVKIPGPNSVGWDNLRKYREDYVGE